MEKLPLIIGFFVLFIVLFIFGAGWLVGTLGLVKGFIWIFVAIGVFSVLKTIL